MRESHSDIWLQDDIIYDRSKVHENDTEYLLNVSKQQEFQ